MLLNSKIVNKGSRLKPFSLFSVNGGLITEKDVMKANGIVVAFICNHCPYVKDIIDRIVEDFNELEKLNVGTIAIMPNDAESYPEDSFENMKKFSKLNKFKFHYLYDEEQNVAESYGAVCTPDFFCFDNNQILFYRGRLDNLKYKSKEKKIRKKELLQAFKLKIDKNETEVEQHSSMGCSIKWKKTN
ncbi:MAG: thioredoxin family protein [Pseudomonadota bacterium]|nr:thioredoxin family protein [Pseudomonadota bacterium]